MAPSAAELLEQIAAVLATGNLALLDDHGGELMEKLPAELLTRVRMDPKREEVTYAAALFAGDPQAAALLRVRLAARAGALIPVITSGARSGRYPLYRLVAERVVSMNTTAAGGNTTLMTLGA